MSVGPVQHLKWEQAPARLARVEFHAVTRFLISPRLSLARMGSVVALATKDSLKQKLLAAAKPLHEKEHHAGPSREAHASMVATGRPQDEAAAAARAGGAGGTELSKEE